MKTNLNYKECSFILNRSEEYCLGLITRELGITVTPKAMNTEAKGKAKSKSVLGMIVSKGNQTEALLPKDFKSESTTWRVSVDRASEITNINVAKLINNVNTHFFKTEACVEYLLKKVSQKYKPNSKTGAMPLSIVIPEEVTCFMSQENQEKAVELCKQRISPKVTYKIVS